MLSHWMKLVGFIFGGRIHAGSRPLAAYRGRQSIGLIVAPENRPRERPETVELLSALMVRANNGPQSVFGGVRSTVCLKVDWIWCWMSLNLVVDNTDNGSGSLERPNENKQTYNSASPIRLLCIRSTSRQQQAQLEASRNKVSLRLYLAPFAPTISRLSID